MHAGWRQRVATAGIGLQAAASCSGAVAAALPPDLRRPTRSKIAGRADRGSSTVGPGSRNRALRTGDTPEGSDAVARVRTSWRSSEASRQERCRDQGRSQPKATVSPRTVVVMSATVTLSRTSSTSSRVTTTTRRGVRPTCASQSSPRLTPRPRTRPRRSRHPRSRAGPGRPHGLALLDDGGRPDEAPPSLPRTR